MLPRSLGRPSGRASVLARFVFLCTIFSFASAQLLNSQFFTNGMAISDSPSPCSQANAGSNLIVAIDLSGGGKLSQDAFLPTSALPSAYQSLNIYLVSGETNVNLTISQGPQLLQQEPGSTVKHLNWPIPSCVFEGNYNLTLYELSRINQVSYYSITPIPIVIKSKSTSPCSGAPTAKTQPQAASPPPQQPWLTPGPLPTTLLSSSVTLHTNSSRSVPTAPSTSSGSGTVTITLSPSPTTLTFISTMTVPTTVSGIATVFTTASTMESVSTVPPSPSGAFLPVNSTVKELLPLQCVHWLTVAMIWVCIVIISPV